MAVFTTLLESSLNFLSNNQKTATRFGTVRKKSGVKILTGRNTV